MDGKHEINYGDDKAKCKDNEDKHHEPEDDEEESLSKTIKKYYSQIENL